MLNPTLMRSYGSDNADYQFNCHGEEYKVHKRGGRVIIQDWIPDPVTPFDKQLIATITRRFFINLELQRQSFLKAVAMEVFV